MLDSTCVILPEYHETIFVVKQPPQGDWPDRFAVITACNPHSAGERAEDQSATIHLRKHLSRMRFNKHPVVGTSPDWSHQEAGFAVWGLTLEQALEIGRNYRQNGIFWIEHGRLEVVSCENSERLLLGGWLGRCRLWSDKPTSRIYVIRLDPEVMKTKRFRDANPSARQNGECLYVGMTSCSAEERFDQHKRGYKACSLVKKHGIALAWDLFPKVDLVPVKLACRLEIDHANSLRELGYGVWQK